MEHSVQELPIFLLEGIAPYPLSSISIIIHITEQVDDLLSGKNIYQKPNTSHSTFYTNTLTINYDYDTFLPNHI